MKSPKAVVSWKPSSRILSKMCVTYVRIRGWFRHVQRVWPNRGPQKWDPHIPV